MKKWWNGTSAVLIMGSTGEVSMLTPEERRVLVDHFRRHGRHDPIDVVERLGREAGFSRVARKRLDPSGFYALLRFVA